MSIKYAPGVLRKPFGVSEDEALKAIVGNEADRREENGVTSAAAQV